MANTPNFSVRIDSDIKVVELLSMGKPLPDKNREHD